MPLESADVDAFTDDLYLGVTFAMLDVEQCVVCRVSKAALEDRAAKDRLRATAVETFQRYRKEIEGIASRKFDQGSLEPVVLSKDLAPIRTTA
jgi:thioredoxin-related protein